jgi:hypothetical protein
VRKVGVDTEQGVLADDDRNPRVTNVLFTRSKVATRSARVASSKRRKFAMFTLNGQKP